MKYLILICMLCITSLSLKAQSIPDIQLFDSPETVIKGRTEFSIDGYSFKLMPSVINKKTSLYHGNKEMELPKNNFYLGQNKDREKVLLIVGNSDTYSMIETKKGLYLYVNGQMLPSDMMVVPEEITESLNNYTLLENEFEYDIPYFSPLKIKGVETKPIIELELAVETTTKFWNRCVEIELDPTEYLISLYQMISYIYERDMNIRFKLTWIKQWTATEKDPYKHSNDANVFNGFMYEIMSYWQQNYSHVERDLVHVLTQGGGGGLGNYNAICENEGYNYSVVSPVINKRTTFFSWNYDVHTIAHETGHNFGAPHTHSCFWENVPLDTCVVSDENWNCLENGQKAVKNPNGSIMSYCRETGYQNVMYFHPTVAQFIREKAETYTCLSEIDKYITLVSPDGTEEIYKKQLPIKFYSNMELFNIYLSTDLGETWIELKKDFTYKSGDSINIDLEETYCSNTCLIKIEDALDKSFYKTSLLPFTIRDTEESYLWARYSFDNGSTLDESGCGLYNLDIKSINSSGDRFGGNNACLVENDKNIHVKEFDYNSLFLTVSFWIYRNDDNNDKSNFITLANGNTNLFEIYNWGNIGVSYWVKDADKNITFKQLYSGYKPPKRTWTHVAFTFTGTVATIYINGKKRGSETDYTNIYFPTCADIPLYIGRYNDTENVFDGRIDDIRIYTKAWDPNYIEYLMNIDAPSPTKAPDIHTPLNGDTTDINLSFQWESVESAYKYHFKMCTDTLRPFETKKTIYHTSDEYYYVHGLDYKTRYYWKVDVSGVHKDTVYGDWNVFYTKAPVSVIEIEYDRLIDLSRLSSNLIVINTHFDTVGLFDLTGNSIPINIEGNEIKLQSLSRGIYFLQLDTKVYRIVI